MEKNKDIIVMLVAALTLASVAYYGASFLVRRSTKAEEKQQEINASTELVIAKSKQSESDFKIFLNELKNCRSDFIFRAWRGSDILVVRYNDAELSPRALMSGFAGSGQELDFGQLFGLIQSDLDFKRASEFERKRHLNQVLDVIRDNEVLHLAVLHPISLGEYAFSTEKFPIVVPAGAALKLPPASLLINFDNIRARRSAFNRGANDDLIEINLEQDNYSLSMVSLDDLSIKIPKEDAERFSLFLSRVAGASSGSEASDLVNRLRRTEYGGSGEVVRPAWLGLGWMIIRVKRGSGSLSLDFESRAQPRIGMYGQLEGLILLNPETGEAMRAWDFR